MSDDWLALDVVQDPVCCGLRFQSQLVLAALGEDFCRTGFLGLDLIHTQLFESYTKKKKERKKERKKNLLWISGIVIIITLKA